MLVDFLVEYLFVAPAVQDGRARDLWPRYFRPPHRNENVHVEERVDLLLNAIISCVWNPPQHVVKTVSNVAMLNLADLGLERADDAGI